MNTSLMGLVVSLMALSLCDFYLTYYGVKRGLTKEVNPMMRLFISLGWHRTFALKMMWTMLVGFYMMASNNVWGLIIANLIFAGVCMWNYFLIKRRLRQLRTQKAEQMMDNHPTVRVISVEKVD